MKFETIDTANETTEVSTTVAGSIEETMLGREIAEGEVQVTIEVEVDGPYGRETVIQLIALTADVVAKIKAI